MCSGPQKCVARAVLEIIVLHVVEGADLDDAGIVDEHIDRHPLVQDARDRLPHVGAPADVTANRHHTRFAEFLGNQAFGAIELARVARQEADVRALIGKLTGQHQAQSA